MDIEQLATSAFKTRIAKTDRLKPYVNEDDKEPSFDGNIYIFDNKRYSKKNIKRVSVQVKGKATSAKCSDTIKYSVSLIDLNNYRTNGGVIFVVVYLDPETGDAREIYYASLLPFRIAKILKKVTDNKGSISISFKKLPSSKKDLTELFLNFYSNAQKQVSFANTPLPTLEELKTNNLLESLSFSYISLDKEQNTSDYPKILNGKELYVYANIKGGVAPIPVEFYTQIDHITMSTDSDMKVSVKGKVYYTQFTKIISEQEITFNIGSCFSLIIPNKNDVPLNKPITIRMNIKIKGTLQQRIQGLRFVLDIVEHKSFELDGCSFPADFAQAKTEGINADELKNTLEGYEAAARVLEKLHVTKDLQMDGITEEELWKLNSLIRAVEDDTPFKKVQNDLPRIVFLSFSNLQLLMATERVEDGVYKVYDFFTTQMKVAIKTDDGVFIPSSQFGLLKAESFTTIDNLYLPSIIKDFERLQPNDIVVEAGNQLLLEILLAYDLCGNKDLLDTAKQLSEWTMRHQEYLTDEVIQINALQIIRRERELTYTEKQSLNQIIATSDNPMFKAGSFILLNEVDEADKLIDAMTEDDIANLQNYPLFRFYNGTKHKKINTDNQAEE